MPKKNISPSCKSDCNTRRKSQMTEFPHRLCFWDERRDCSLREHQPMNPQEQKDNLCTRIYLKHHKTSRELSEQKEDVTPLFTVCTIISFKWKHVQWISCLMHKVSGLEGKQRFCCMTLSGRKENHTSSDVAISPKLERYNPKCKGWFRMSYMWTGSQGIRLSLVKW